MPTLSHQGVLEVHRAPSGSLCCPLKVSSVKPLTLEGATAGVEGDRRQDRTGPHLSVCTLNPEQATVWPSSSAVMSLFYKTGCPSPRCLLFKKKKKSLLKKSCTYHRIHSNYTIQLRVFRCYPFYLKSCHDQPWSRKHPVVQAGLELGVSPLI